MLPGSGPQPISTASTRSVRVPGPSHWMHCPRRDPDEPTATDAILPSFAMSASASSSASSEASRSGGSERPPRSMEIASGYGRSWRNGAQSPGHGLGRRARNAIAFRRTHICLVSGRGISGSTRLRKPGSTLAVVVAQLYSGRLETRLSRRTGTIRGLIRRTHIGLGCRSRGTRMFLPALLCHL